MGLFKRKGNDGDDSVGLADDTAWSAPGQPDAVPEPLADLAFFTLDHALSSISEGGALIPLVLLEDSNGRNAHRFVARSLEEGLAKAKKHVAKDSNWRRAVLAYDGYLSLGDQRNDAIYALAWDRDSATACAMAHRYVPGSQQQELQRVGNPVYLGAAPAPGL